jgi:hypothetical protein
VRVVLVFVLLCVAGGRLAAQPAAAQAEALFRQGKDLMAAGKIAEACGAFEASQKAGPATSTLLNLANCREKNGELATAWALFLEVERETRAATDKLGKEFHRTASERASKLEPRLSYLTIGVAERSRLKGLEVTRDGTAVDSLSWSRRLPLDGGKHVIEARAPGHKPWTITIDMATHDDDRQVEVPPLEVSTDEPGGGGEPHRGERPSRVAAWTVSVAALMLGGGALGFELWARSTYDKALKAGDPGTQDAYYADANTKRYVADGLAVGALGCTAVAVILFVRSGSSSSSSTASVQPSASRDSFGLALVGSW